MKIATCTNRKTMIYINRDVDWETFIKKIKTTIRTKETVEAYKAMSKDEQAAVKDAGGFVAGELRNGRRNNQSVISRSMITLDADNADKEFLATIGLTYGYKCAVYTTHKHTPEKPRYRWIIPLDRDVTPEE